MNSYKNWVHSFVIGAAILSLIIAMFNYKIDSFNLFKSKNENVVKDLLNKNYVSYDSIAVNMLENIYEPIIQKNIKVDVLAIGSSRTMLLHRDLLFNKNVSYYNFTAGTARLSHYVRVVSLFNKHGLKLPKNIILGIDPWVFDAPIAPGNTKELLNKYKADTKKYEQLFNYEYTKINFEKLKKNNFSLNFEKTEKKIVDYLKDKNVNTLFAQDNSNVIMSPDGDLYYPLNKKKIEESFIQKRIEKCSEAKFDTKCIRYKTLNNFSELKYLIDYLKNKNINVIIFLAPFEPSYYEHVVKNYNFATHNRIILEFFRLNSLKVVGSYNPNDFNLTREHFYDAIHPTEKAIQIIFKDLKKNGNYYFK